MLNDKEIESTNDDSLGIEKSIENFKKKYITSTEFEGSLLLNGNWGIGKTSFLNSVESKTKINEKIKFVKINFWLEDWDAKPAELIIRRLWPWLFWIIKFFPIIITLGLAIATSATQSLPILSSSTGTWFALVVLISISTIIVDKFSSEAIFTCFLSKYLNCSNRKKIIFIFDDFDRIDKERRAILHSTLFNLSLYENIVLIIVGEYSKIVEKENDSLFIQKIIGTVVNMPLENMSGNIWEYFEKSLENISTKKADISELDKKITTCVRDSFIAEKRTMREAKQLLNSLQTQYFDFNTGKVNFGEQLAICYIFQFHNKIYEWLIDNCDVLYSKNFIPYNGFRLYPSNELDKKIVIADRFIDDLGYELDKKVCLLIFEMFNNENILKFKHPSISEMKYFQLYQVQNTNLELLLSIVDVDEIFIEKNSSLNCFMKLEENQQMEQFYSLFDNNYLDYKTNDPKLLKPFLSLLRTLTFMRIVNESNESVYTYSYVDNLFFKVSEKLIDVYGQLPFNLFIDQIFELSEIDLSEKLFVLPYYIPARSDEQTEQQKEIVVKLFEKNSAIEISEQKMPFSCYYYSYHYYRDFPLELQTKVDTMLKKINEFNNDDFYNFVLEKLITKSGYYGKLNLEEIYYSETFKEKFNNRISKLSIEQIKKIKSLIKH
ncbi:P-loop NTPase fold protein [Carnobacterium maltaromaticum]|uniref:P-loop NTPase fold protein n=1 Tax=Carnobacterium maltaromaticum TaxID=2751 RepID=UPI0037BBF8A8